MSPVYLEGAACHCCGDDAVKVYQLAERSRIEDRALCGDCADLFTFICPDCYQTIRHWVADGERVFSSTSLYCGVCAKGLPVVVTPDAFNEARR